jgi:protein involved in polysaccharide export with SLBB domain
MIEYLRKTANHWVVALGLVLVAFLTGCQSGPPPKFAEAGEESGNMFHLGDRVTVKFLSSTGNPEILPEHTERIHEDGTITLSLIGSVPAAGRTAGQLQKDIHDRYVPKYFPELTVTVLGEARYFYVDGEVRLPGQKDYPGDMTVVKAISVAGGFTDFAKKTKVQLTHGGHTQTINADKAIRDPRYDVPVFPGDKIYVRRRIF